MPLNVDRPKKPLEKAKASPLDGLNKHRRFNAPLARLLSKDPLTRDTAIAIANCSQRLSLQFELKGEELRNPKVLNGILCNRRLCPFCEWRRTRALRAKLIQGLRLHATENPKTTAIFLTLTVKNCHILELRNTIKHLHYSYKRLTLIKGFPTNIWFRRTEVTIGKDKMGQASIIPAQFHPHIHILLLVGPSYWGREYWSQLRWQQEWQMAARLNYSPIVDVKRAYTKQSRSKRGLDGTLAATLEAAKYSTKASDLLKLGDHLPDFHMEMKNLRLYGISSNLKKYIGSNSLDTEELLDHNQPSDENSFHAIAQWFDTIQEYQFIL